MCVWHLKIKHILVNLWELYFLYSEPTHLFSWSPKFCLHLKTNKNRNKQTKNKLGTICVISSCQEFLIWGWKFLPTSLPPWWNFICLEIAQVLGMGSKQQQNLWCSLRGVLIYKYSNSPWSSSILCLYSRIIIRSSFWWSMIYLIMGLGHQCWFHVWILILWSRH